MNIFAFPFYPHKDRQVRFTTCGAKSSFALPAPSVRWLPFMLTLPKTGQGLDCVNIWNASDDTLYDYVTPDKFLFEVFSDAANDYVFYYGGIVSGMTLPCGQQFYLEVKGQFSEIFQVADDLSGYLKIDWKHKLPIGRAIYQTGFINRVYLDAILSDPTYKVTEEGDEDGHGVFQPTRSRLDKTFKFDTTPLPEFLIDALAAIPLHNGVTIGLHNDCREVKVSPDWDLPNSAGCTGIARFEFSEEAPLESDFCGNPAPVAKVDLTNYVPKVWLCDGSPDPTPNWVNTSQATCEIVGGKNTGYQLQDQEDQNPNSPTYQQTRTLKTYNVAACPIPQVFSSAAISELVYKNDCPAGFSPIGVTYTLPAGHVMDSTSQTDVDTRAQAYFDANKQAYANANDTCQDNSQTGDEFAGCFYGSDNCWGGFIYTTNGSVRPYNTIAECQQCQGTRGPGPGPICNDIACF